MVRREVFEKVGGYDVTIPLATDFDFWLRAATRFQLHTISEPLIYYRVLATSLSGLKGDERRDWVMNVILPKLMKFPGFTDQVRFWHVWALRGRLFKGRADEKKAWFAGTYWYIRALLCNPFHFDAWAGMVGRILPAFCYRFLKQLSRATPESSDRND